jgi:lipopolysaccharide export system ATP-binding protein
VKNAFSLFLKHKQAWFLPMTDQSAQIPENDGENAGDGLRVVDGGKGLVVNRIGKSFNKRPVVRSVSLSLKRGEAVGLLGPNGAGKTTCFYMITGLIAADTGSIEVDGHDVTRLPMYRRARLGIGYLPQEASIFRGLTAEQNIRATAELLEPDGARLEAMVEALLAEFGITHIRNTPSVALSGGERRRVEIARCLATHPSYILLDEPFAGIDPIAVGEIRDLVKHLKNRGIGVLITDHNVRDALDVIDRAYILHDGRVLKEGTPAEIVNDRDVRRVYLGEKFSL